MRRSPGGQPPAEAVRRQPRRVRGVAQLPFQRGADALVAAGVVLDDGDSLEVPAVQRVPAPAQLSERGLHLVEIGARSVEGHRHGPGRWCDPGKGSEGVTREPPDLVVAEVIERWRTQEQHPRCSQEAHGLQENVVAGSDERVGYRDARPRQPARHLTVHAVEPLPVLQRQHVGVHRQRVALDEGRGDRPRHARSTASRANPSSETGRRRHRRRPPPRHEVAPAASSLSGQQRYCCDCSSSSICRLRSSFSSSLRARSR